MDGPRDQSQDEFDRSRLLPRELAPEEVDRLEKQSYLISQAARAAERIWNARRQVAEQRLKAERMEAAVRRTQEQARQSGSAGENNGVRRRPEGSLNEAQVEALALRAVVRFSRLNPLASARAWQAWRQAVVRRFPACVASEIIQRAQALREMTG